jgi:hypothetical protein
MTKQIKVTKKNLVVLLMVCLGGLALLLTTQRASAIEPATGNKITSSGVTFDIDALKETYYQDWQPEADAVDVNMLEPAAKRVTFDIDTLKETYYQDWRPEAEAVDVTMLEPAAKRIDFDVATLRETYYQDWGIEAEAVDVNILEQ